MLPQAGALVHMFHQCSWRRERLEQPAIVWQSMHTRGWHSADQARQQQRFQTGTGVTVQPTAPPPVPPAHPPVRQEKLRSVVSSTARGLEMLVKSVVCGCSFT